jgi:hypothetical protein
MKSKQHRSRNFNVQRGSARAGALALTCLVVGGGAGSYIAFRAMRPAEAAAPATGLDDALSPQTKDLLVTLPEPVEVRLYSVFDPATTSAADQALAERVWKLLNEYQNIAGANLKLKRYSESSTATLKQAQGDGIQPFNIDKGDACYLGVAVVSGGRKQSVARLSPEWQHVLESDVTRTIASVTPGPKPPSAAPAVDATAAEQVRALVPNAENVSVQEGNRMLREEALKEFRAAAEGLHRDVQNAQEAYTQAQARESDSEKQAALKRLQEAQAAETEKLKEITARLQAQLTALEQLKSQAR